MGLDFGGGGGGAGDLEGVGCGAGAEVAAVAAAGDLRGRGDDEEGDERAQPATWGCIAAMWRASPPT